MYKKIAIGLCFIAIGFALGWWAHREKLPERRIVVTPVQTAIGGIAQQRQLEKKKSLTTTANETTNLSPEEQATLEKLKLIPLPLLQRAYNELFGDFEQKYIYGEFPYESWTEGDKDRFGKEMYDAWKQNFPANLYWIGHGTIDLPNKKYPITILFDYQKLDGKSLVDVLPPLDQLSYGSEIYADVNGSHRSVSGMFGGSLWGASMRNGKYYLVNTIYSTDFNSDFSAVAFEWPGLGQSDLSAEYLVYKTKRWEKISDLSWESVPLAIWEQQKKEVNPL
jgi:hypothetical protein